MYRVIGRLQVASVFELMVVWLPLEAGPGGLLTSALVLAALVVAASCRAGTLLPPRPGFVLVAWSERGV